tara:strand:+ start:470 stop:1240 length:771 start_codon:yes stop_codon:yes gene_type:complete
MIIDSHCHLDYTQIYSQLDNVVNRAIKKNVKILLTICTTLESYNKIKIIINKYNNIYGTFGIHPHETNNYKEITSKSIIDYKKQNKKIIGIGETGLDYFYNYSDKETQKKVFIEHILAAEQLQIPLIVHSRSAEIDTFEILNKYMKNKKLKVIIHCFTGSKNFAEKLIKIGCYISVSGIITFKKSKDLSDTVSCIPVDKLLVETDSPYLAPEPNRGKDNEPSYITHTIEKLSAIKKIDKEKIIDSTTNNFKRLFKI